MMTGVYPSRRGLIWNTEKRTAGNLCDFLPGQPLYSHYLSQAGYRNAYVGKWHCGHERLPVDYGIEGWSLPHYGKVYMSEAYRAYAELRGFGDARARIEHYLNHPEVHIRIFRALLGTRVVSRSLWQERVSGFPNLPSTPCSAAVAALMQDLDSLKSAVTGGKIDDMAMGMLGTYRAIKKAKEACEELFDKVDGWL